MKSKPNLTDQTKNDNEIPCVKTLFSVAKSWALTGLTFV